MHAKHIWGNFINEIRFKWLVLCTFNEFQPFTQVQLGIDLKTNLPESKKHFSSSTAESWQAKEL